MLEKIISIPFLVKFLCVDSHPRYFHSTGSMLANDLTRWPSIRSTLFDQLVCVTLYRGWLLQKPLSVLSWTVICELLCMHFNMDACNESFVLFVWQLVLRNQVEGLSLTRRGQHYRLYWGSFSALGNQFLNKLKNSKLDPSPPPPPPRCTARCLRQNITLNVWLIDSNLKSWSEEANAIYDRITNKIVFHQLNKPHCPVYVFIGRCQNHIRKEVIFLWPYFSNDTWHDIWKLVWILDKNTLLMG